MGLLPALFLIFLTLKLCEVIAWSWWLVFAPILVLPVLVIVIGLVAAWAGADFKVRWR